MREKFKTLKKFPKYVISNKGYVINKKTGNISSPYLFNGYFYVGLIKKNGKPSSVGLHRLVIDNFKDATKKDYAIHLDFNTGNNEENNLDKVRGRSGLLQWKKFIRWTSQAYH